MPNDLSSPLLRVRVPPLKKAERLALQDQFRVDAQGWWAQRTSQPGSASLMIGGVAEFTCVMTAQHADGSLTTDVFWRGDDIEPVVLVEDRPGDRTQLQRVAPFAETKKVPTKGCKWLKASKNK